MITANVGNSRAILVDKFRKVRELTVDHTPRLKVEKKRIENSGGRIALNESGDSYRVYKNSKDTVGLPITRSIGDLAAHRVGVTFEPEIKHFNLEENDQILILASGGIW